VILFNIIRGQSGVDIKNIMKVLKSIILAMNRGGFINRAQAFLKYASVGLLSVILEELIRINFLIYYPMGSILLLLSLYSVYVIFHDKWKKYRLGDKIRTSKKGDQRRYFPTPAEFKLAKALGTSLIATASLVLGFQTAVTSENYLLVSALEVHQQAGNYDLVELSANPRWSPLNYFNNTLPPGFFFTGGVIPIYTKAVVGMPPEISHYLQLSSHLCTTEMDKGELLRYLSQNATVVLPEEVTLSQMRDEAISMLLK
jgi:hypothetical protein